MMSDDPFQNAEALETDPEAKLTLYKKNISQSPGRNPVTIPMYGVYLPIHEFR